LYGSVALVPFAPMVSVATVVVGVVCARLMALISLVFMPAVLGFARSAGMALGVLVDMLLGTMPVAAMHM